MLKKEPDQLILDLTRDYFQLDKYLSDDRMKTNFQWLKTLTTLFEQILGCLGQDKRIADILVRNLSFIFQIKNLVLIQIKLPGTVYFDALYEEIRRNDPHTGTLRFNLILQTLKIINHLLTINPHAESNVTPFIERIGAYLNRLNNENEVRKFIFSF